MGARQRRTADHFTTLHGRRPTAAELADALGITVAELRRHRDEVTRSDVTSLNMAIASEKGTNVERIDTIAAQDEACDPWQVTARDELKTAFRAAFARLPRREREVAVLLYVRHMTLAEVGTVLGVTKSRVCQIHAQLKRTLRTALTAGDERPALAA